MILYLSSQKFGTNDDFLKNWLKNHNNKILLIFNALDAKGQEKINKNVSEDLSLLNQIGFEVTVIDLKEYFEKHDELSKICQEFNAFCVIGGNVFVLRQAMKYSGFDIILKKLCNDNNHLFVGYSAGCCVLSDNLDIFKLIDEPIDFYNKGKIINEGLGFIDYAFIPHYKSNYHKVHLIDEIVNICEKENIKYKTCSDGEVIIETTI